MGSDFDVIGRIIVDEAGAAVLGQVNGELDAMGTKTGLLSNVTRAFGDVAHYVWANLVLQGVEMATRAVEQFVSSSIDAAKNHQVIQAQLARQIADTGASTGMTVDKINQLAASQSKLTGFTEDQIVAGETQLMLFKRIGSDMFPQATVAALDLARAKNLDLNTSFRQVGMALGDPTSGMGRLNTQFRLFDHEQMKAIEDMAKAGDVAGAQKLILNGLSAEVGGAAKAYGETFAGKMDIFNARLDTLKITIGNFLIPILSRFIGLVIDSGIIDKLQTFFDALGSGGIQIPLVSKALSGFSDWWKNNGTVIQTNAERLRAAFIDMFVNLSPQIKGFITEALNKIGAWFEKNGPLIQRFSKVVADFFINYIIPAVTQTWTAIEPLLDAMLNIILDLAELIMDVATGSWPDAWSMIKDIAISAFNGIVGFIMGAAASLVRLFGQTPNNIATVWSANWHQFTDILSKLMQLAMQTVRNTLKFWITLGFDLMMGLVSGITSAIGAVVSAVSGAVNSAVTAAKAAAHIRSPSKVFADIGRSMMEGLAVGLGDGFTMPISILTRGIPQLGVVAASGNANPAYYSSSQTSYSRRQHFGAVNNYYIGTKPLPVDTVKNMRKLA